MSKKGWWWWWWWAGEGGGWGASLSPTRAASFVRYHQCRVSPSLCVCVVFFFLGGGGVGEGGLGGAGVGGIEKAIESFQIFHYSQAFIHISKYENIDSDTESVFTLDSAFKISRHATKPKFMCMCVCVCFFFPDSLFAFEDENDHEDEI